MPSFNPSLFGSRFQDRACSFLLVALLLLLPGCLPVPKGQISVDDITVEGEDAISEHELKKLLATRETSRFLGVFQGVFYEHQLYNHHVLQVDIQRIERIYRAHGYYHARVISTRVFLNKKKHVRVVLQVDEGEPTRIEALDLIGLPEGSVERAEASRSGVERHVRVAKIFQEDDLRKAADGLRYALRDQGFAQASVKHSAKVDLVDKSARLRFIVTPGLKCVYGPITINDLTDGLSKEKVRQVLNLEEGAPYSQSELEDAQAALLALGVFSSVQIKPQLDADPEDGSVPLSITTAPTPLRTFELGGGAQLDVVRAALHGQVGWRHRNFLGGLRNLETNLRPGVAFYPMRLQNLEAPTDYLPFVSADVELRQPGFLEARTDGLVGSSVDIYPVLLSSDVDPEAPVLGYSEEEAHLALQRSFGSHLFLSPKYALTFAQPFTYRGPLDPDLRSLTISAMEVFARFDTRDDLLFPTRGIAASLAVQYAGGPFGGQVHDVRFGPELRAFIPVGKRWTLALRAGTELLFPFNWGDASTIPGGGPAEGTSRADWVRDTQIGLFRSLFAGGPNSNRGYAQRGIGPHGVIPFYVPAVQGPDVAATCEADPTSDPENCLLPLGGRTKWEATIELRFPLVGELYGAAFCDAADVAPNVLQYRFDRLHLSCGLGVRYSTPVGPLRLDVGYRIPGLQTLGSSEGEGIPPTFFGAPIAVAFSIGEAF